MTDLDELIRRFLDAVDKRERPRAEECRAAASFIRSRSEFKRASLSETLRRRLGGEPAVRRGRRKAVEAALDNAIALRLKAGEREPTRADFDKVAEERGVSEKTLRRHWNAQRENAQRWQPTLYDLFDMYSREIDRLREEVGEAINTLAIEDLLKMAAEYRNTPANKRLALCQKFRLIVVPKTGKG